ncbi:MAG: CotH kinase family protein, partial [Nitrospira sp.]|nr:CotH kinase family protein [Nitrospira sp.]
MQVLEPVRGAACLVYMPPGGGPVQTLDHIRITPRQGGWKIRLQKDQPLLAMTTINVLFEYQPRFVLAEHLAFELYRQAGTTAPLSGHWRVFHNGRPAGYHLYVEQPNNSFFRRVGRDPEGDVYKLLWYGRDLVSQHEKKNNPETGHAELVQLIEALQRSTGDKQWQLIQQRIHLDSFINYYAVNMCIQNWDGFFKNYFLYRAPGAAGKWEIIPWDEDKTWGDYDNCSPLYDWYTMPLTFGMKGDRPRSGLLGGFEQGGIHGGPSWWRQPGWFSGPLLANPQFRAKFRTRLREICDTIFTPEQWEPVFARMERELEPEIRYRASLVRGNGAASNPSVAEFKQHMDSFRRQVANRRQFLLKEIAKEE